VAISASGWDTAWNSRIGRPNAAHPEAAVHLAQHVGRGDRDFIEPQAPHRVVGQELDRLAGQPRDGAVDHERGDAFGPGLRRRSGEDGVDIGLRRVRDVGLLSVQREAVPAAVRPELQMRRIRAVLRLGQGKRGHGPAGGHRPDVPLHQVGRAGLEDRVATQALEGQGGLGLHAFPSQRLAEEAERHRRDLAARREDAFQQTPFSEGPDQWPVHPMRLAPISQRHQRRAGHPAGLVDQGALLVGEPEGHPPDLSRRPVRRRWGR
jgi:hypothetical protein